MAALMAEDPTLTAVAAAEKVKRPGDYTWRDALPRALREKYPRLLPEARERHAKQVEAEINRLVRGSRVSRIEISICGAATKQVLISYLRIRFSIRKDIWNEPCVVNAVDDLWRAVRPSLGQQLILAAFADC
jgi:hypothetical protein